MYPVRPADMRHQTQQRLPTVTVAAEHPVLGLVYWCRVGDLGPEALHTLTTDPHDALQLPSGWRGRASQRQQRQHIDQLLADTYQVRGLANVPPTGQHGICLLGGLASIQRASGQMPAEFLEWLKSATWVDTPAPARCASWCDEVYGWPPSTAYNLPVGRLPVDLETALQKGSSGQHPITLH